jgi:hypothetical protein
MMGRLSLNLFSTGIVVFSSSVTAQQDGGNCNIYTFVPFTDK